MGAYVEIAGQEVEVLSYDIVEESTPLVIDDSSGSVGTIVFETPQSPDIYTWYGEEFYLYDTQRGITRGVVDSIVKRDSFTYTIRGFSWLNKLNLYDVVAPPVIGTLHDAVETYLGLAGVTDGWEVEADIADIPVMAPGWKGELWYHLKSLAATMGVEISLTSGVIRFRKPRQIEAIQDQDTAREVEIGGSDLARAVEVYCYHSRELKDEPIYPSWGWENVDDILSMQAGEMSEFDLELSASVTTFTEPQMVEWVDKDDYTNSVYTVVTSDGRVLTPSEFERHGGYVFFELGEDTTSMKMWARGPDNIKDDEGDLVTQFYFALGDSTKEDYEEGGQYSTLRINGYGVEFRPEIVTIPTGVPEHMTDNEVGITIDDPFIQDMETAYNTGHRLAVAHSMAYMALTGSTTEFKSTNEFGRDAAFTYDNVQTFYSHLTYDQVQNLLQGMTNDQVHEYLAEQLGGSTYYMMGNGAGARVFDQDTGHWFRIRTADVNRGPMAYTAEIDTLHQDAEGMFEGVTYNEVQELLGHLTYNQVIGRGIR